MPLDQLVLRRFPGFGLGDVVHLQDGTRVKIEQMQVGSETVRVREKCGKWHTLSRDETVLIVLKEQSA